MHGPLGWVYRPDDIAAVCERIESTGKPASFAAGRPDLNGHWKRLTERGVTGVFLWEWEQPTLGRATECDDQRAGTCVSRGTYRACQDSLGMSVYRLRQVSRATLIAFEPIYAGSRVQIGKGQIGREDGSIGAWAAEWVNRYGVHERKQYGRHDLTKPNEQLAVDWGMPNRGVPNDFPKGQVVPSIHLCRDADALADALSAEYGAARCSSHLFGDRDSNTFARRDGEGGHCECVRGVFLTERGKTAFVMQQSWGENKPSGPRTLTYAGGRVELPVGCYSITFEDMAAAMATGETWAMGVASFQPEKVSDFVRGSR